MPSLPSTVPSVAPGRRSFAFAREDAGRASGSAPSLIVVAGTRQPETSFEVSAAAGAERLGYLSIVAWGAEADRHTIGGVHQTDRGSSGRRVPSRRRPASAARYRNALPLSACSPKARQSARLAVRRLHVGANPLTTYHGT